MSDPIAPETVAVVPAPPVATTTEAPVVLPPDHPLVKTLALLKEENKALKPKASAYDQHVESEKTETQRLADATAQAQKEAADARAEALSYRLAAAHGVTPDNFDLLGTGDEAAITARAERIGGLLAASAENAQLKAELEALRTGKPAPTTARPVAALKPGATPANTISDEDAAYSALYGPS